MSRSFIDPSSSTPIFQQIIDELERRILTDELGAGDFLPSVREFAVSNSVNPNTVAKAYQQLQALGLVESVRGTGLKVIEVADAKAQKRKKELLTLKIDECIEMATALGTSPNQLIELIRERSRK